MDVWIFKNTNILLTIKRNFFWFKGTFLEVTCLEGSHLRNKPTISNNILILINLRTFCNLIWSRNDSLIFELETKKYHSYYSSVTFHLISKCPIKHSWMLENLTTQAALKFSLHTVCTISALTQSSLRGQTIQTPFTSRYLYFQSKPYPSVCVCGPHRAIYQS